jgi:predicted Zn finger-like uncharacterized protein
LSLATRCSHCGTVFRVVQDQLKVSEGWVRCGRCAEVFNALEGLFDLDREGTVSAPAPLRPAPAPIQPAPLPLSEAPSTMPDERGATSVGLDMADTQFEAREDYSLGLPNASSDAEDDVDPDDREPVSVGPDSRASGFRSSGLGSSMPIHSIPADAVFPDEAVEAPDDAARGFVAKPAFLREADRSAQWERPRIRRALTLAAFVLGLTLIGQWVALERDAIAARWPDTAPLLTTLCETLGCSIEPPRRVDALVVESSGLSRLEGGTLYRLQVNLRNRETMPVMVPSLDLALTDTRSDVLARRVLSPRDFGSIAPVSLAGGAELQLTAVIDLGERRVAGYTVELFYP